MPSAAKIRLTPSCALAEGVAHAPLAVDSDADTLTDRDTGGTERRPADIGRSATPRGTSRSQTLRSTLVSSSRRANCTRARGNGAPAFAPRSLFAFVDSDASGKNKKLASRLWHRAVLDGPRDESGLVR